MDMDSAVNFLIGSILFGAGILVLCVCIVVVNNIFHKWWKPVNFGSWMPSWYGAHPNANARFMTQEEADQHIKSSPMIEPGFEQSSTKDNHDTKSK